MAWCPLASWISGLCMLSWSGQLGEHVVLKVEPSLTYFYNSILGVQNLFGSTKFIWESVQSFRIFFVMGLIKVVGILIDLIFGIKEYLDITRLHN
jgi:hypothetical protein